MAFTRSEGQEVGQVAVQLADQAACLAVHVRRCFEVGHEVLPALVAGMCGILLLDFRFIEHGFVVVDASGEVVYL